MGVYMQSPSTFSTHGEAVSGVPSLVTFRQVQLIIDWTRSNRIPAVTFDKARPA
jgi:hypothetical protein